MNTWMKLYSPECLHNLKDNYFIKSPGRTFFPSVQMIHVNPLEPVTTDKTIDKLYIFIVPDRTFYGTFRAEGLSQIRHNIK